MDDVASVFSSHFSFLGKELIDKISKYTTYMKIPPDREILREGQYVKVIPLVVSGLIKVYTRYEEKELLLYYIQPKQSCIMSFSAGLKNEPSRIFAVTEETTEALLLAVDHISHWISDPAFNQLFFQLYNLRYVDLLNTIHHLIYDKLDMRLLKYLQDKKSITGTDMLTITHKQIANELGTAREVISRLLKKLEKEDKIRLLPKGIKIH